MSTGHDVVVAEDAPAEQGDCWWRAVGAYIDDHDDFRTRVRKVVSFTCLMIACCGFVIGWGGVWASHLANWSKKEHHNGAIINIVVAHCITMPSLSVGYLVMRFSKMHQLPAWTVRTCWRA